MIRTEKRMRLCMFLLMGNLIFIWGNSLLPGEVSGAFSDWVKSLLAHIFPMDGPEASGGFLLRKLAHFSEFAFLGVWLGWLFAMMKKGVLLPAFWGVAAACVDETIQCFVPGRGPGLRDVAIDSCGVLTGLALLYLGRRLFTKPQISEET